MRTDAPIAGFWVWLGKEFEPLPQSKLLSTFAHQQHMGAVLGNCPCGVHGVAQATDGCDRSGTPQASLHDGSIQFAEACLVSHCSLAGVEQSAVFEHPDGSNDGVHAATTLCQDVPSGFQCLAQSAAPELLLLWRERFNLPRPAMDEEHVRWAHWCTSTG
jgi:hypothetical protein